MNKSALGRIEFSPNQVVGQTLEKSAVFKPSQSTDQANLIQAVALLGNMAVDHEGLPIHTRDAYFRDCASNTYGKFSLGASPLTSASVFMAFRSGQFEKVEPFEFPEADPSRVHVVLSKNNPVFITQDDDKAFKAQSHFDLDPCISISRVRDYFSPISMLYTLEDDAWPAVAKSMLSDAKKAADRDPIFEHTPKDLPASLAQQRLFAIDPFLKNRPENLETTVELMEILMADRHNRSLDWNLIRESSMKGAWFSENHEISVDDLEAEIDELQDEYHRLVSTSPAPRSTTDTDAAIAKTQVTIAEKIFALDRHPDNSEAVRLG